MSKITHKQIREFLGHNGDERKVRITRDGLVLTYGSADHADRSKDFWAEVGTVEGVAAQIEREMTNY